MRPLTLVLLLALAACEPTIQTSSGADYLARYDAAVAAASGETDALVRQAAAIEPILTFPARFGLARIENGRLTAIPAAEAELWSSLAGKHAALGAFVPISPLVAAATASALPGEPAAGEVIRTLRLGAARQHVDAVLVYEVGAQTRRGLTPLALMDLTIIGGALLPTRNIEARGMASALLMDVRNGYPYGTASAEADLSALSATFGKGWKTESLRREATLKAAAALVPEVDSMLTRLARQMPAAARNAS